MSDAAGASSDRDGRLAAAEDSGWARVLLAAERAVDLGARILGQGRSHIGALIAKGDRDFATEVDMHIESAVKASLAPPPRRSRSWARREVESLVDEARWVLDPIDGTINFSKDSPLCAISLSLLVAGSPCLGSSTPRCWASASWPARAAAPS